MSNPVRRRKKRIIMKAADLRILEKLKPIEQFMEGAAVAIEDLEKMITEIRQGMVIYNKFVELLNKKGLVTNEEVTEELRKDGRVQVAEDGSAKLKGDEPDVGGSETVEQQLQGSEGEGSDNEQRLDSGDEPPVVEPTGKTNDLGAEQCS